MAEYPPKRQITVGGAVSIETKENQGSGILTDGIVSEILTSAESHPHGIKVKLVNGQVGRVKKTKKHIEANSQKSVSASDQVNPQVTLAPNTSRSSTRFADLDATNIPKTEDVNNEFKEFYQYDSEIDKRAGYAENDKKRIEGIMKSVRHRLAMAVCSMGNSYDGGIVYVGVRSDGKIMGLEKDMKLGRFKDYSDEFARHMADVLTAATDDKVFVTRDIQIRFAKRNNKTVCIIQVLPSSQPLFLNEGSAKAFYVRGSTPQAVRLKGKEQFMYIKKRFPGFGG